MSQLGIFKSILDPAFVADIEGRLIETNDAFVELLGSGEVGTAISDVWPEAAGFWESALAANDSGKQLRIDIGATNNDGRELVFDVRLGVLDGDDSVGKLIVGFARDVTSERSHSDDLELKATIDPLTGAFNRGQLDVLLAQSILTARRRKTTGTFIFIDLDGFKSINDAFGHSEGDRVLKEIVNVLHANLRDSDVVARFGGDEFGAILTDSDSSSGYKKANQLAAALREIKIDGREEGISAAFGVAVYPMDGDRASDVIKRADSAMYRAKRSQSGRVVLAESK